MTGVRECARRDGNGEGERGCGVMREYIVCSPT